MSNAKGLRKKVALIGWHPDSPEIDYSNLPVKMELNPDILMNMLVSDKERLISMGYDADWIFLLDSASAYNTVVSKLKMTAYDSVLIGAGVRLELKFHKVFESLVNAIHEYAPQAKICFNTNPTDTAESIQRWI